MHMQDKVVFFFGPVSSDNLWVNDVVPAFAALSAQPSWQESSNYDPVLSAKLLYLISEDLVFFRRPLGWTDLCVERQMACLRVVWVSLVLVVLLILEVQPSLEAPYFGFVWHELAKSVPGLVSIDLYESGEFFVFLWCPNDLLSWRLA